MPDMTRPPTEGELRESLELAKGCAWQDWRVQDNVVKVGLGWTVLQAVALSPEHPNESDRNTAHAAHHDPAFILRLHAHMGRLRAENERLMKVLSKLDDILVHNVYPDAVLVLELYQSVGERPRPSAPTAEEARVGCAGRLDAAEGALHAMERHPGFEYEITTGPRKSWYENREPEGEGWILNIYRGRGGWERFDSHEEAYWVRPKSVLIGGERKEGEV